MYITSMLDIWNNFVNTVIRDLPDYWKALICLCAFALGCLCFAKSIVKKDKKLIPFSTGLFLLSLVFFAIVVLYIIYW